MLLEKRSASELLDNIYGMGELVEEMANFALATHSSFKYDCVSKKVICITSNPEVSTDNLPIDLVLAPSLRVTINKNYQPDDITRQHFSHSMPHMFTRKIIEMITEEISRKKLSTDSVCLQKSITPANIRKKMFEEAFLKLNARKMMKENPKLTKKFSNLVNKIKSKHFKGLDDSEETKTTSSSSGEMNPDDQGDSKNIEVHHKEKILVDKYYVALASRLSKVYTEKRIFGGNLEIYDRSFLW